MININISCILLYKQTKSRLGDVCRNQFKCSKNSFMSVGQIVLKRVETVPTVSKVPRN